MTEVFAINGTWLFGPDNYQEEPIPVVGYDQTGRPIRQGYPTFTFLWSFMNQQHMSTLMDTYDPMNPQVTISYINKVTGIVETMIGMMHEPIVGSRNTIYYQNIGVKITHCIPLGVPASLPYATLTLWTPSIIPLHLWYKADNLPLSNGSSVRAWYDSSGNNRNMINNTVASQPIFIVNGRVMSDGTTYLPAVRFDGIDDTLTATGANVPPVASIFVALKHPSRVMDDQRPYGSTSNRHLMRYYNNVSHRTVMYQSGVSFNVYTGSFNNTWHIQSHIYVSDGVGFNRGSLDGGVSATVLSTAPIGTAANMIMASANNPDMDFGEMIVVPSAVSTTLQAKIEGYLAWKWNLQGNLPINHPFKSRQPFVEIDG